ncbi:MAG: valine--tRNA ligase, partial [Spirochaetia bacterium]|nr:valine--tRNA ligase [Spirochaetia bacterium]
LVNKQIPLIADDFVDPSFGTGAVKITPAHDPNDFLAGKRHKLPLTRILDDHGKTNAKAGKYAGISREKAREKILEDLEHSGFLEKTEDIKHAVGECYRCQTLVEPISSLQWFVDIKPLAEKAIEVVKSGQIEFLPKRWENTYFEWLNNIQDWCISRQLWWGHRIPAYYCENPECRHVHVAMEMPVKCDKCGHKKLVQDADVLDTWFSSGLWPFSTLLSEKESVENKSWPAKNLELDLFYPTTVLVTGFDIIFFWVARMIMMGVHFMKDVPFKKVYIHGLVRDAERKKMSKSKGNVVNPLEKMEEYGADAFRFFMISILPEGKDIIYDESRLKGYSAFCNKIWNTARFIKINLPADYTMPQQCPGSLNIFDHWILTEYKNAVLQSSACLDEMRFSEYAQTVYDFFWKDFCDNYLELSKTSLKDDSQSASTRWVLNYIFEGALKLLHPVMPFITEELYSLRCKPATAENSARTDSLIIAAPWPDVSTLPATDREAWQSTELMLHLIYKIRNLRGELLIAPGEKFKAALVAKDDLIKDTMMAQKNHIINLARLSDFSVYVDESKVDFKGIQTPVEFKSAGSGANTFSGSKSGKLVIDVHHLIDAEKEKTRLAKEIENLEKYIRIVDQKLSNKDFVERAPADLIAEENRKKEDAANKLVDLENLLKYFK